VRRADARAIRCAAPLRRGTEVVRVRGGCRCRGRGCLGHPRL
jgi:hypothetical protein